MLGEYGYVIKPLEDRRQMLKGRIQEAMVVARRTNLLPDALALPVRGPRTVGQWIAELRGLLSREGYRVRAAPMRDELWRLVEDPSAKPQDRAAAAVTLGPSLDDQGRKRLRVVAAATAAPKLRMTIESVAQQDDARLLEVLVDVAPEGDSLVDNAGKTRATPTRE